MLHVRTSHLIIAGDGTACKEIFSMVHGNGKHKDVMLMKIFGLTNKSERMSSENFFHGCYFVFLCICGNI